MVRLVIRNSEIAHPDGLFSDLPETLWAAGRGLGVPFFYDVDSNTVHLNSVVQGRTVVIDPGHGGRDRGGHGVTGYCEAEGVLGIARALAALLRSAGARVVLTRAQDETLPLEERLAIVKRERPDVFILLHTEGLPASGGLRPAVVYNYRRPLASFRLAGCIAAAMVTYGGMPPFLRRFRLRARDIGGYNGLLLGSGVPAVVIECASHHYPEQERLLLNEDYLKLCARSIYRGLCRHFGAEMEDFVETTEELRHTGRPAGPPADASGHPQAQLAVAVARAEAAPMPPAEAAPMPPAEAAPMPPAEVAPGPPTQAAPAQPGPVTMTQVTARRQMGMSQPQPHARPVPALAFAGGQILQVAPPGPVLSSVGVSDRAAEVIDGKPQDTGMPPMPEEFIRWPRPKPAGSPVRPHG